MNFIDSLLNAIVNVDALRVASVSAALAFAWLAANQHKSAWIFGFLNISLGFLPHLAIMNPANQLVALILSGLTLYGFYEWHTYADAKIKRISWRRLRYEIGALLVLALIMFGLSKLLAFELSLYAIYYYCATILGVYFAVRKVLEVWILWTIIYLINALYSFYSGNYLVMLFTLLYIPLTIRGFYMWTEAFFDLDDEQIRQEIS